MDQDCIVCVCVCRIVHVTTECRCLGNAGYLCGSGAVAGELGKGSSTTRLVCMAVVGDEVVICDAGNHRMQVFAMGEMGLL